MSTSMSMFDATRCFVSFQQMTVIDVCRPDGTSWINGQTLEQMKTRYPDATEMSIDDATARLEKLSLESAGKPVEISEEQFMKALESLPPAEWHHNGDTESFKCPEPLSGRLTSAYVRLGDRYFSFVAPFGTPHGTLVSDAKSAAAPAASGKTLADEWNAKPASGACRGIITAMSESEVIQHIGKNSHVVWSRQALTGAALVVGRSVDISAEGVVKAPLAHGKSTPERGDR